MRSRALRCWLAGVLLLIVPELAGAAGTVHDLGAVPGAIRQPEGRRSFAEQIEGKAEPDRLGTELPAGLTRNAIIRLIAPEVDPSRIMLVGAKPWAHLRDGFVAIVCAAHDAADKPSGQQTQSCEDNPDVILGLLTLPPGGAAPRLVARTRPGFTLDSDWSPPPGAPILLPSVTPGSPEDAPGRSDDRVASFDLAPYRIAPEAYAFGVRSERDEGYAGGYATYETLQLFAAEGAVLRRILAQPIYGFRMTAGDWNSDGTRRHQVEESKLVVAVVPARTVGHNGLKVTELRTRHSAVLHWNATDKLYWVPGASR